MATLKNCIFAPTKKQNGFNGIERIKKTEAD